MHLHKFLFLPPLIFSQIVFSQVNPGYKNPSISVEARVKDLLSRMTPEEKFWQLFMIPGDLDRGDSAHYQHGIFGFQVSAGAKGDAAGQLLQYNTSESAVALAKKINSIQHYFIEHTRLGIPIIAFDEALHGLVREGCTSFPQSIGLAATWDTSLMHQVGAAIARETKARGIRDILSPVINIASDVRWGRTEETYGEDPFLTAAMGVSYVSEFENRGIITTPKHFVANTGDGGRDSYPIHYNERLLEEIYFPPFIAAIRKGHSRSLMTAYNSVDGSAASSNGWLLTKKLKQQWGFRGFVISDANAVGGEVVLHHTAATYEQAGIHALENGLDVIFQTDYQHFRLFQPPFLDGRIKVSRINDAVSRVLRAKFELGLFEHPYVLIDSLEIQRTLEINRQIAFRACQESLVLLKNKENTLPLQPGLRKIAIIGEEATAARQGGYSGPGIKPVSILEGIRQRAGKDIEILYATGAKVQSRDLEIIDPEFLSHGNNEKGLEGQYFNNLHLEAGPVLQRVDPSLDFHWTLSGPDKSTGNNFYSVRWQGKIRSPHTGKFKIGLQGNDGYRMYLNGQLLVDRWDKVSYTTQTADFQFTEGEKYDLKVEFYETTGNAQLQLIWDAPGIPDWQKDIQLAVDAASQADIAIIAAGIHEGEFQDRAYLSLPGHQEALIKAVAATGKPLVVLLTGGSAITLASWIDQANAVMDVWYPGEEGGHAIAAALFGDYNPAGRLPVSFPVHESQLPLVYNHKSTGRGDDYYNLSGEPLFPFGYGLSYTKFEYDNIRLSHKNISAKEPTTVSCKVSNRGPREGDEVVQLYIKDLQGSVSRPVMELKGFQRIHLLAGESKEVSFTITPELLEMRDKNGKIVVEPGDFSIMLGASSKDIRLKEILTVKGN